MNHHITDPFFPQGVRKKSLLRGKIHGCHPQNIGQLTGTCM